MNAKKCTYFNKSHACKRKKSFCLALKAASHVAAKATLLITDMYALSFCIFT